MVAVFASIILLPTDPMPPPRVNTWGTEEDPPEIPAMADTVIEKTEITETLIAIVPRVVGMRGSVIVMEGTVEIGETAEVRPPPMEVAGDTRPNTGAGEATQGVHQGEEPLVATGGQMVREVLANPQRTVQTHVGELTGETTSIGSRFFSMQTSFVQLSSEIFEPLQDRQP
jgi:hypothetical protein